jgi:purine-nucleoside phosphorylase
MSIHIGARKGDIAETVLMPGDPLRAKFAAETFLENVSCYNEVRGMLGFTGTYKGQRISIQGSGMGQPSLSIYVNELLREYGVKRIMRIGSCGSLQPQVKLRDVVLAMSACTDSAINNITFKGMTFAPTADFTLFNKAVETAKQQGTLVHGGSVLASDIFYNNDPDEWNIWASHGVLAIEMETAALYTLAAKYGAQALTLLTVSDSLVSNQTTSSEEREKTFTTMMELALETAIA